MARSEAKPVEHVRYHKDGTFGRERRPSKSCRTGTGNGSARTACGCAPAIFKDGEQVGEWTTYDKTGAVYKVTTMKPKRRKPPA